MVLDVIITESIFSTGNEMGCSNRKACKLVESEYVLTSDTPAGQVAMEINVQLTH